MYAREYNLCPSRYNYGLIESHYINSITVERANTKKKIQFVDNNTTFNRKKYSFYYKVSQGTLSSFGDGTNHVTYDDALEYVKDNIEWMIFVSSSVGNFSICDYTIIEDDETVSRISKMVDEYQD